MVVLLFYLLLTIAFVAEGLGFKNGREISYITIVLIPTLLFLTLSKKIETPKYFKIFSVLFFTFSAFSVIFSVNIRESIGYIIFYASCFLTFVFVYNNQEQIKKYLLLYVLGLGVFFSVYSTLLNSEILKNFPTLKPVHGFQFVSDVFASHSQLGNFLVLPIIICLYFIFQRKYILYSILLLVFFLPYFLLSYSRSAYLALAVFSVIFTIYEFIKAKNKTLSWIGAFSALFMFALAVNFSFITLKNTDLPQFLNDTRTVMINKQGLIERYMVSGRDQYLDQSIKSILKKPVFGVGPGNFSFASIKYTKYKGYWTNSSHNIFLDIFVESGIFAGFIFLGCIGWLLWRSEKNIFLYLALIMLLVFQTDYSFRIYTLTILLFIFLGAVVKKSETISKY